MSTFFENENLQGYAEKGPTPLLTYSSNWFLVFFFYLKMLKNKNFKFDIPKSISDSYRLTCSILLDLSCLL